MLKKIFLQDSDVCCLVPELCCLTGFTLEMREDHNLMRELRNRTMNTPDRRQKSLIEFVKRVNGKNNIFNFWYNICKVYFLYLSNIKK